LDRLVLDLAVENSNLKAQRLSFGPAQAAADEFRDALEAIPSAVPAKDPWRLKAVIATAVAAVREIQVLQAPHIADPDDAAM
jgi:thioredoxin-like negative regulator of GroEL